MLSRASAFVYWHAVTGLLACLAELPVVGMLLLLDRSPQNLSLVPLCLILAAPALSAAVFALRERTRAEDLAPARSFLRGLRLGWADSMRAWAPSMLVLAAVSAGVLSLDAAGVPQGYAGVLIVIGVLAALWGANALVIATVFSFRWRDTLRLAVFYLGRRWPGALGVLALLVTAAAVVLLVNELVLWVLQIVWVAYLVAFTRPLVDDVTERFTA